jgi:hypothetical protein
MTGPTTAFKETAETPPPNRNMVLVVAVAAAVLAGVVTFLVLR